MDKDSLIPSDVLRKVEQIIRHNADSFFEPQYKSTNHKGQHNIDGKLTIQDISFSSNNIKIYCRDDNDMHTFILTHSEFDNWFKKLKLSHESEATTKDECDYLWS